MFISVLDIFKLGIGPFSSHTMGPMTAAAQFRERLLEVYENHDPTEQRVTVHLYGSLALTGKGHATDRAVALGLCGFRPASYVEKSAEGALEKLKQTRQLQIDGHKPIRFNLEDDIVFRFHDVLPFHTNGMCFELLSATDAAVHNEVYYSIGGGFIVTGEEAPQHIVISNGQAEYETASVPYPFKTAREMLCLSQSSSLSIAQMKRGNELHFCSASELLIALTNIWQAMSDCIDRGLSAQGVLPGGLGVRRRAAQLLSSFEQNRDSGELPPHWVTDVISMYALAVNEENAAGGAVVTASTNGAAGVVPAVLRYFVDFVGDATPQNIENFLLTASAIGGIIKENASISGAECGCQVEVGSASAMAAAGLCAVLGGTAAQIENAAEIALEVVEWG